MAKRVKKDEGGEGGAISNVPNGEKVMEFVKQIETLDQDLAKEKSEFMTRCKVIHGDKKEVYGEAKNAGFKKKALKEIIKARSLERELAAIGSDLEGDDSDSYATMALALEKLGELGQAALKAAA